MDRKPRTITPIKTFETSSNVPTRDPITGMLVIKPLRMTDNAPKGAPVAEPTPEVEPLSEQGTEVTNTPAEKASEQTEIISEENPEVIERDAEEIEEKQTQETSTGQKSKRPRPTPTPIQVSDDAPSAAAGGRSKQGTRSTS